MTTYDRGDLIRLTGTFTTLANTKVDPDTVTLRIKTPDRQVLAIPEVTREEAGVYRYDFEITQSGMHYYRFEGEGGVIAAAEKGFNVEKSHIL